MISTYFDYQLRSNITSVSALWAVFGRACTESTSGFDSAALCVLSLQ
uniref:Uncharacterized protein n=1 Tax=Chloracidobacterium thermophilum TaxID=458033 RepID=A8DJG0_9BACT|nr:hypothetical protein YS_M60-F11.053 [Chloracidobacterium thermophilum]